MNWKYHDRSHVFVKSRRIFACFVSTVRTSYPASAMIPEDGLRHFDSFVNAIEDATKRFPEKFRQCSLEALIHGAEPVFCLIRAGISSQTKCETLDYGKARLRREVFSSGELSGLLTSFNQTGRLVIPHGEITFAVRHNSPQQWFHTSRSPYHPWPGCLYELGATGQATPGLQDALVGRGLPPFLNPKDAITNWIRVPVGDNDGRHSRLLLFIPDFTARLGKIAFADAILDVRADFESSELSVSVLASDGRTTFRKTKTLKRAQRFKLMQNPILLRVFITNERGEILDSFAEEEPWTTRERVIFAGARYSDEVMDMIRGGETDTVEFKEFIRLEDKRKAAELVKAVISFANTRGGTIFIGVTDDAEVVGVEEHIPHDKRKATSFEPDYFAGVRSLLQQKLNRIPPIEMRTERMGDKRVFVIEVAEGVAKPYTNVQTRETFVRRGASDVRPDPDTELRQMLQSGLILDSTGEDVY